jgi:N-acetylneuraminic acid mutarotase
VSVYNGKIFVIGGYFAFGPLAFGPTMNMVEVYDIVRNSWTTGLAPMPTAREGLMAATVGDNIFAIGGFTTSRAWFTATGVVEEYNIVTNTWTTGLAPMPTARGTVNAMGGVACGNEPIFVIGGMTTSVAPTNVNEAYLPSLNQWIERPLMPTARGEAGTGIVGSQLFVIGGGMPPEIGPITNVNEAFECSNTIAGKVTSG